jgi:hypothetical protein
VINLNYDYVANLSLLTSPNRTMMWCLSLEISITV